METKLIFDARLARRLIKHGYQIIDIKPLKEDRNKTIFVFEAKDGFAEKLKELTER